MFADSNLIFFGSAPYTAGNFASLAGLTTSTGGNVINLTTPEDMGIGDGEAVPKLACYIGTGITSASASLNLNFQFQGSTDSSNWTTYVETGALTTTSLIANAKVFAVDVPHRAAGASLPQYYRLNITASGNGVASVTIGTVFAGIVIQRDDSPVGLYRSGFTVV